MSAVQRQYSIEGDLNAEEFLAGQRDCEAGVAHKDGRSESYDRGYGAQYEIEQVRGAMQ